MDLREGRALLGEPRVLTHPSPVGRLPIGPVTGSQRFAHGYAQHECPVLGLFDRIAVDGSEARARDPLWQVSHSNRQLSRSLFGPLM